MIKCTLPVLLLLNLLWYVDFLFSLDLSWDITSMGTLHASVDSNAAR